MCVHYVITGDGEKRFKVRACLTNGKNNVYSDWYNVILER